MLKFGDLREGRVFMAFRKLFVKVHPIYCGDKLVNAISFASECNTRDFIPDNQMVVPQDNLPA